MLTIEISDKDDTVTICNGKQKVVLSMDDVLELYQEIGYHFFTARWKKDDNDTELNPRCKYPL